MHCIKATWHRSYFYILIILLFCPQWVRASGFSGLPDQRTHQAIARGLKFLARNQAADGSWHCDVGYKLNMSYRVTKRNAAHVGISALACIAFLAGGHLPNRGPYGKTLAAGLDFILGCIKPHGYITKNGTRMYSHAFATLFLAEIYGMTYREDIRAGLSRAVDLIVKCQNEQGGWRYEPLAIDADMSITVCQVQALRAARNIGIKVPKKTITRAIEYVLRSANPNGSFKYQDLPSSRDSFALTAAGVTALFGAGVYSDQSIYRGLEYLLNRRYAPPRNHYFYYYGHYYAVQAMYLAGGRYWELWYPRIEQELLSSQNSDGSWMCAQVGKEFATAVATIMLQIPYGYLPIFQK